MEAVASRFAAESGLATLRVCRPILKGPPMSTPPEKPMAPAEDAEAEVDIWWGGYAGRAMLPSFLACAAATVVLIATAIYLANVCGLHGDPVRYLVYALAGSLWTIQLLRWGSRMVGTNYRVTTRRIYCWQGLLASPGRPIDLARVSRVLVEQSWWERELVWDEFGLSQRKGS